MINSIKFKKILYFNQKILLYFFIFFVFLSLLIIIAPSDIYTQTVFDIFMLIFLSLAIYFNNNSYKEYIKLFVIFITLIVAFRYFYWRSLYTLNFDSFSNAIGSVILYIAEIYAFIIALLGGFVSLRQLNRKAIPLSRFSYDELPTVDIFIPTYNEPIDIIKVTTLAASVMDYPKEKFNVYILDDGGTTQKLNDPDPIKREFNKKRAEELKKLANEIGQNIHYLTREKNEHAKAGNINEALKKTNGDLILILDCDHVPTQDFLRNVVGFFIKNPKLFLVQTPHKFYNPDPIEKNLRIFRQVPSENDMFYEHIQKGLDFWEASFFCGSAAMLRRKYLEEVGGIAGETITEDAETALGLHAKGYESYYYNKGMVFGLQPETFSGFIVQRSRWASGMIQIFLLKNPFKFKKLKWYQKLSYLNSNFYWFFGFARTIFLISPLFFILFNLKVYNCTLLEALTYAIGYYFVMLLASYYLYGKYRWPFFSEVYETAQSLFLMPSILSTLKNPRAPEFKVTPKGEDVKKDFVSPFYMPIFILFHLVILSIIIAVFRFVIYPDERGTLTILIIWQFFNAIFLALGIIIAYERSEKRKAYRVPSNDTVIFYVGEKSFKGVIKDVSLTGIWIQTNYDLSDYLEDIRDHELKFMVRDDNNTLILLHGKVINANKHNIRMIFDVSNIEEEKKIVQIVYASSRKWEYFNESKVQSPLESFKFLLKLTFKDFIFAYKQELKQFINDILNFIKKKFKGVKYGAI